MHVNMSNIDLISSFANGCKDVHFRPEAFAGTSLLDPVGRFLSGFPSFCVVHRRFEESFRPPRNELMKNLLADIQFMLTCPFSDVYMVFVCDRSMYTAHSMQLLKAVHDRPMKRPCKTIVLHERKDRVWECQFFSEDYDQVNYGSLESLLSHLTILTRGLKISVMSHKGSPMLRRFISLVEPSACVWSISCTPDAFVYSEATHVVYQLLFFTDRNSSETRALGTGMMCMDESAPTTYINLVNNFKFGVRGSSDTCGKCVDCAAVSRMLLSINPCELSQTDGRVHMRLL